MGNCIGKKSLKSKDRYNNLSKPSSSSSPRFNRTNELYKTNPNNLVIRKKQLTVNYDEYPVKKKWNSTERNRRYVLSTPLPDEDHPYYTTDFVNYSNIKVKNILTNDDLIHKTSSNKQSLSPLFNLNDMIKYQNIEKIRHTPSPPISCSKKFKKIGLTTSFSDSYYAFKPTINVPLVTLTKHVVDEHLTSSLFNNNSHHSSNNTTQNNNDILPSSFYLIESTTSTFPKEIKSLNDSHVFDLSSEINMGQLINTFSSNSDVSNEIGHSNTTDDIVVDVTIVKQKEEENEILNNIKQREKEIVIENNKNYVQDENKYDNTVSILNDNQITLNEPTITALINNDETDNLISDDYNNLFIHQNVQEIDPDNDDDKMGNEQQKSVILATKEEPFYKEIDNKNITKPFLNEIYSHQVSSEHPLSPSTSHSSLSSQLSFSSTELVVSSRSTSTTCSISPKNHQNYTKNHCPTNLSSLINCQQISVLGNNQFLSSHIYLPVIIPSQQYQQRGEHTNILNDFHQYIDTDECFTLHSIVDDIIQQQTQNNSRQFIRIHRRKKTVLLGHKKLNAIHISDISKYNNLLENATFIYDDCEQNGQVFITKYCKHFNLNNLTQHIRSLKSNNILKRLNSCDCCSTILNGHYLNIILRSFLISNATYDLVSLCFNDSNTYGYISTRNQFNIRQYLINNSKMSYLNDIDFTEIKIQYALRINSWPEIFIETFLNRTRHWPKYDDLLTIFENSCYIIVTKGKEEKECKLNYLEKCSMCEKTLLTNENLTYWSYSYSKLESKLIKLLTIDHKRFSSLLWMYLCSKLSKKIPWSLFKHSLFYFFERYECDTFKQCDILLYFHFYIEHLFNYFNKHTLPNYFDSKHDIFTQITEEDYQQYKDSLSTLLSLPITYANFRKNFILSILPVSCHFLIHLRYLIHFQCNFIKRLLSSDSKTSTSTFRLLLEIHEQVLKELTFKSKIKISPITNYIKPLTLDALYQFQEQNAQIVLDYLPFLRDKEQSLLIHNLWSVYIQYFNSMFDDLLLVPQ